MSVYIKGFPLPNNCGACPLRLAWCRERIYMVTRPERCPLVPVPKHGRLLKVLKTERECVSRDCNRDCRKCDLSLERDEILNAYDTLIALFADPAEEGE